MNEFNFNQKLSKKKKLLFIVKDRKKEPIIRLKYFFFFLLWPNGNKNFASLTLMDVMYEEAYIHPENSFSRPRQT